MTAPRRLSFWLACWLAVPGLALGGHLAAAEGDSEEGGRRPVTTTTASAPASAAPPLPEENLDQLADDFAELDQEFAEIAGDSDAGDYCTAREEPPAELDGASEGVGLRLAHGSWTVHLPAGWMLEVSEGDLYLFRGPDGAGITMGATTSPGAGSLFAATSAATAAVEGADEPLDVRSSAGTTIAGLPACHLYATLSTETGGREDTTDQYWIATGEHLVLVEVTLPGTVSTDTRGDALGVVASLAQAAAELRA